MTSPASAAAFDLVHQVAGKHCRGKLVHQVAAVAARSSSYPPLSAAAVEVVRQVASGAARSRSPPNAARLNSCPPASAAVVELVQPGRPPRSSSCNPGRPASTATIKLVQPGRWRAPPRSSWHPIGPCCRCAAPNPHRRADHRPQRTAAAELMARCAPLTPILGATRPRALRLLAPARVTVPTRDNATQGRSPSV